MVTGLRKGSAEGIEEIWDSAGRENEAEIYRYYTGWILIGAMKDARIVRPGMKQPIRSEVF